MPAKRKIFENAATRSTALINDKDCLMSVGEASDIGTTNCSWSVAVIRRLAQCQVLFRIDQANMPRQTGNQLSASVGPQPCTALWIHNELLQAPFQEPRLLSKMLDMLVLLFVRRFFVPPCASHPATLPYQFPFFVRAQSSLPFISFRKSSAGGLSHVRAGKVSVKSSPFLHQVEKAVTRAHNSFDLVQLNE